MEQEDGGRRVRSEKVGTLDGNGTGGGGYGQTKKEDYLLRLRKAAQVLRAARCAGGAHRRHNFFWRDAMEPRRSRGRSPADELRSRAPCMKRCRTNGILGWTCVWLHRVAAKSDLRWGSVLLLAVVKALWRTLFKRLPVSEQLRQGYVHDADHPGPLKTPQRILNSCESEGVSTGFSS